MPSWGVLQDPNFPYVPGTVSLNGANEGKLEDSEYEEPKKRGGIVLSPQPSDSPNDPLNWSNTTKMTILLILSFTAGVTVSLGPMVTTGLEDMAAEFGVSIDQIAFGTGGLFFIMTGLGTFFTAAAAAVWGKRPVFIVSAFVLFGTSSWGFFAVNYLSLTMMRVVQGLASAPLETLVSATISEIFFVHEKGKMLSVWNLFVMGGVKLGQLIAGFIIQNLGFKYTFGICGLLYAGIITMLYLFVPETVYFAKVPEKEIIFHKNSLSLYERVLPERRKSYSDGLDVFQGRVSKASFWSLSFKPFPLVTFPAVIYASLTYTVYAVGLTLIAFLQDNVFSAAPYNLNASAIGMTNLPLFGVGIVGTLVSGYCADAVVQFMTKHNNGVYEPEFRLVLMIVATVLSTVAYIGFGYSVAAGAPLWIPISFLGVQTAAVPFACSAMFTYVMDCHPPHAAQAFVTMNFIKAVLSLTMTHYVNSWYETSGPKSVFTIVAIANLAVSSLSLPMYIFGKRLRSKIARSSFHQKF